MLRKLGTLFALVTVLVLSSSSVHAISPATSSIDFAALQKTCAVVEIHLNGTQHTITCTKARGSSAKTGVMPYLGRTACWLSDAVEVKNYNYSGDLCFSGLGYLGVQIYQVDEVDNHHPFYQSWIRDYDPSGVFCTIEPDSYALFSTNNPAFVTQLDLGNSDGGDCPHL